MSLKGATGALVMCLGLLGTAPPASAQAAVDVSVGYEALRFADESFPGGWYADVAGKVAPALQLVGLVAGNYKTITLNRVDIDTKVHRFMGGLRVGGSGNSPFGQILFGSLRGTASTTPSGLPISIAVGASTGVMQLGAGINLRGSSPVGVRLGVDYLRLLTDDGADGVPFAAGLVFGK